MKQITLLLLGLFLGFCCIAQQTFPKNGVYDTREELYVFKNATIYKTYNQKLEKATLVIKKGKVIAIGKNVKIPKGAVEFDCTGKTIYPSFIDLYTNYGMPKPKAEGKRPDRQPQMLSNKEGAYSWNEALKTDFRAHKLFTKDKKAAKEYIDLGFGTVMTHRMDGISRGAAALVLLGNEREHLSILKEKTAHHYSFHKGTSTQNYPSSLMGGIALLRQTYYDAKWYKEIGKKQEENISLASWNRLSKLPQIFEVNNKLEILRAAKLGKEFGITYIMRGGGDEYQRLDEIKKTGSSLILPLNFPSAYDVEDPFDALQASFSSMKHWELAPTNPALIANEGITFALTTSKLKNKGDFWKNLRKAVKYGLSEEAALKALTVTPAQMIGIEKELGSLEKGKIANFIITSGNIFQDGSSIYHNWIRGKGHVLKTMDTPKDLRAVYRLNIDNKEYGLLYVEGKVEKLSGKIKKSAADTIETPVNIAFKTGIIGINFIPAGQNDRISLTGTSTNDGLKGTGTLSDGTWTNWTATFTRALPEKDEAKDKKQTKPADKKEDIVLGDVIYPFQAYGRLTTPKQESYLFKNVTVWTNEADGILENTDVVIQNGKIVSIGKDLSVKNAIVIDGKGKHLTSGIIDEHSHIAIHRGVNEGTQSSSAEVRIGDVINSEDVNIYRQLSGGVTTSQLLHGSANPIGGQAALIKLRWGAAPEDMKFEGADGFIKFALGENVKQSNWGDKYRFRFPQTRMGVEQLYEDYFTRALEYETLKKSGKPYRTDLDLEAVLEIIRGKRFITCHSYVQSEINMLMKVAEKYGFRVNTFTHILEGYKLADKMKKHGAHGSTFSDWWAYKYEVIDAIPYNAAIMNQQGVVVAINSDDAEMARRLNQEAAKCVMYGNMSEEDAWKTVTLNPAKVLRIDDHVGSIKKGKDADLVLWSEHPLSVYAKAEMTFIDGVKYFDRADDKVLREDMKKERARLIQKMVAEKKGGAKTQRVHPTHRSHYHCDDIWDEMGRHYHHHH